MGMAGAGNFQLGAQHQGMAELPRHTHGRSRDGTAMGGHKVHQAKADALHARVGGNVKRAAHQ